MIDIMLPERNFIKIIKEICSEESIELEILCDTWVLLLKNGGETLRIYGYHFDMNTDSSSLIAQDKQATSSILTSLHIPNVHHISFFRKPPSEVTRGEVVDFLERNNLLLPLVCKPNLGTGGQEVSKHTTIESLHEAIIELHKKERGAAVSPFYIIKTEYRAIFLKGSIEFIYAKNVPKSDSVEFIQHNLKFGAIASFDINNEKKDLIKEIAKKAGEAIGVDFASIDIIETDDEMRVIEVNSGVCLEKISKLDTQRREEVKEIYKKTISAFFNRF